MSDSKRTLQGQCMMITTMHCSSEGKEPKHHLLLPLSRYFPWAINISYSTFESIICHWESMSERVVCKLPWICGRKLWSELLEGNPIHDSGKKTNAQAACCNFQKDYEFIFSLGLRWEWGLNYSLHTRLSSNTRTNNADGQIREVPQEWMEPPR